jgi:two-component system sensor histidine kinase DevS
LPAQFEFGIQLTGSRLQLVVVDNGRGFERQEVARGKGLVNLRERLTGIGGSCSIESSPGKGARVRFTLNLKITPA